MKIGEDFELDTGVNLINLRSVQYETPAPAGLYCEDYDEAVELRIRALKLAEASGKGEESPEYKTYEMLLNAECRMAQLAAAAPASDIENLFMKAELLLKLVVLDGDHRSNCPDRRLTYDLTQSVYEDLRRLDAKAQADNVTELDPGRRTARD